MTQPGLVVHQLAKRFGKKNALLDVSFEAGCGEIVGLIGPNGAGKSTTFGILCGLVRPDHGTVTFGGRLLGSDRGQTISLIPETPDVYPNLTVWEHLVFVARLCRLAPGWREDGEALLARFGMLEERATLGHALSKGMRQKTLIASTLLAQTPVLLLDEPMIGLDPRGQRELRDLLREQRLHGTVIVLSTHQLDAAATLCERVVVLDRGRTVAGGTVDEIRALGEGSLEDVFLEITST